MPSRRHHRKSRAGCLACKKKHVKCDEQRPQCMKCLSRGLRCEYEVSTLPYATSPPIGNWPRASTTAFRMFSAQDLELLHHYCTDANASLAQSVGLGPEEVSFVLPKVAFRFPFLLRAILALAALHRDFIQDNREGPRVDYASVAAEHLNEALPEYRQALQKTTEENCIALLMFSSLLTIYVLAMSRNGMNPFHKSLGQLEDSANVPSLDLVSWLRLIAGGMTAIKPWMTHILNDEEFGPCLNSELWSVQRVPETADQAQRDKILADLERLWMATDTTSPDANAKDCADAHTSSAAQLSPEAREALSKTLASLRKTYLWVTFRADLQSSSVSVHSSPMGHHSPTAPSNSPSIFPPFMTIAQQPAPSTPCSNRARLSQARPIELSAILLFLHSLTDDFLLLLHQRHPFTLILIAHYAVLIQQTDIWWMRGLGEDMLDWVIDGLNEESSFPMSGHSEKQSSYSLHGVTFGNDWMHWIAWPRLVSGDTEATRINSL